MVIVHTVGPPPKRILIIRTSAIGDVIMASPLIGALHRKYPSAELFWLLEPHLAPLIENHPQITGVVHFEKARWKASFKNRNMTELFRSLAYLRKQLRQYEFDLAIDVQGLAKSAIWAWLSGAKRRVGFKSKEPTKLFMTERLDKPKNDPEISSEYKKVASYLGCDIEHFYMDIQVSKTDQNVAMQKLTDLQNAPASSHKNNVDTHPKVKDETTKNYENYVDTHSKVKDETAINDKQNYVDTHPINNLQNILESQTKNTKLLDKRSAFIVVCPFTTRAQKHWPMAHWQKLLPLLRASFHMDIVIVGGPNDRAAGEQLKMGQPFVKNACGVFSLAQSIAVIEKSAAVVGVDTGMTHAGIATKVPTLALFGSTRPYLNTGVAQTKVIYLNKSCAPCKRKPSCDGAFHCLSDISPEFVVEELKLVAPTLSLRNVI